MLDPMKVALVGMVVHGEYAMRNQMVYLSANGEVIGQFQDSDLPALVADGTVGIDSLFWRDGMPEWRPLREMFFQHFPRHQTSAPPAEAGRKPLPSVTPQVSVVSTASTSFRPAHSATSPGGTVSAGVSPTASRPANKSEALASDEKPAESFPRALPPKGADARGKRPLTPTRLALRPSAGLALPSSSPHDSETEGPSDKAPVRPAGGQGVGVFPQLAGAPDQTADTANRMEAGQPRPPAGGPFAGLSPHSEARPDTGWRKRRLVASLTAALSGVAAVAAAAWWFLAAQSPTLAGEVLWPAASGKPEPLVGAEVMLVSQQDLSARWWHRLAELQDRAAQAEQMLAQAKALQREKFLAYELAARTSELGDEYNMPDADQLRVARDAAQAEEASAAADVLKLVREKEALTDVSVLLRDVPEVLGRTQTDAAGYFGLPLPASTEHLAVLVVNASTNEGTSTLRGWLVPLGFAKQAPSPLRLSADNALTGAQISEIAGKGNPAAAGEIKPPQEG